MKPVEVYKHRAEASEKQQILKKQGIDARVVVDPLEGRYPALSTFHDVVLMVDSDQFQAATAALRKAS